MEETVPAECVAAQQCLQHYDLNFLMNRAAHGMREAMDAEATAHGITIRGQIVLTALVQKPPTEKPVTQLALGTTLGLDKTTMTAVLDKLEAQGLLIRTPDPNDRRARIPVVTTAGRELQEKLYHQLTLVEQNMLSGLSLTERDQLRDLLRRVITPDKHVDGSCM